MKKNIHILATGKPSRLHLAYNKDYYLSVDPFIQLDTKNYKSFNIYITNDEEIKKGDWFIHFSHGITSLLKAFKVGEQMLVGVSCIYAVRRSTYYEL